VTLRRARAAQDARNQGGTMRPQSIIMFERLFLASLAVSAVYR
jgi:hypothetical protein